MVVTLTQQAAMCSSMIITTSPTIGRKEDEVLDRCNCIDSATSVLGRTCVSNIHIRRLGRQMSRFSFRAWDLYKKQMVVGKFLSTSGAILSTWDCHPDRYAAVMQSTGLLDKNGKEIFEGDVLKGRDSGDHETFRFVRWVSPGFAPWIYLEPGDMFSGPEIIGNIYETPQLIDLPSIALQTAALPDNKATP